MDKKELKKMMRNLSRALNEEIESTNDELDRLNKIVKVADLADHLTSELELLRKELAAEKKETERLRQQLKEKDMQLAELRKLATSIAKQSSQNDVLEVLGKMMHDKEHS